MNDDRRKALQDAIGTLNKAKEEVEQVEADERDAFSSMPESLQQSEGGQKIEENADTMQEVIDEIATLTEKLEELCQ